jgi:very-short-patch-repair endonuclease
LRQKKTSAEENMWSLLRNRNFMGLKFRRQHQIGEYVADFYCHDAQLVVELDGKVHEQKIAKDKKRDAYMQSIGLTVLRFTNEEFTSHPESVLSKIADAVPDDKSSSPCGRGGGEGLPDHIRQLFPSEFEHTEEMGWIPKGWTVGPISKLCEKVQNGGTPNRSKAEYWDGGTIPWLTSGEVRQTIIVKTENFISEAGLKNSSAKWLPFGATVVALYGATAGQVALVASEMTSNQAICGLIPKDNYTFFNYLSLERGVSSLANQARGSAQQNISKGIVEDTKVVIPAGVITEKFETECHPIFSKWIHNLSADLALSRTRDTLLPQLLSGEIRIPEAEKLVEDLERNGGGNGKS